MKGFQSFINYAMEHVSELQYDTATFLENEWNDKLTLSKEDIVLITKIANQHCLALLRQYHEWLSKQS